MGETVIREYVKEDIPALKKLWIDVFGDTEGFCDRFFEALPDMGSGVVAEINGETVGAAYTLNGQELVENGKRSVIGYIYGVGVYEKYRGRGIGGALVKAVYELSKKREAVTVTTLPAEGSLYEWYERIIGLKCTLHRERFELECQPVEMTMPLSSSEYMMWREKLLSDRTHIHLSNYALEFEKQLLNEYGGGYYMTESGICAAYLDGDTALVREALCPSREDCLKAAASVGAAMGAKKCVLFLPSETGESYIASDKPLPPDCVWNLTFD